MSEDLRVLETNKKGRCDFLIEYIDGDKESGLMQVRIKPDPRRHQEIEIYGATHYLDKYLRSIISMDQMAKNMMANMAGLPIFHLSSTIDSTPDYANERRAHVAKELATGVHQVPRQTAKPHIDLAAGSSLRELVFISMDVCGSTVLRKKNPERYDATLEILLRELGTLVGQFQGTILKTTGDGFIAYVDHPSFCSQCDIATDMALSMLVMMRDTVNPALTEAGYDPINIRAGADYGPALIRRTVIPATGYVSTDISSDALNRAVKIEQSCKPNTVRIGRELYELIHVQWLERASEIEFDSSSIGIKSYKVYEVS